MGFTEGASPRQLARAAGALYLANIVFGAFAIGVVPAVHLWLLIAGVDVERWTVRARAGLGTWSAPKEQLPVTDR